MNWFLVDHNDEIVGLVLWDPSEGSWQPSPGYRLVSAEGHAWERGWKWDAVNQRSYDPSPPPPPPPDPSQEAPNVVT